MTPAMLLRRFCCCNVASPATRPSATKKQLVFMGSPQVSASVLETLLNASKEPNSIFQGNLHHVSGKPRLPDQRSTGSTFNKEKMLAAIVTQPPSARDRGRKVMPSPVAQLALDWGFSQDRVFTPERAGEENFLAELKSLNPELCVTAAYGNILPTKFLNIPQYGTVNLHPSLLPLYRGAAPVQRALQDGVKETGVSLAFTVRALDAGPVIASERVIVDDHIKAPELLSLLFDLGSKLLVQELPFIFDGSATVKAQVQDDSKATLAPKITSEESWLSFDQPALVLHNKVRAFAGWPGTRAKVQIVDGKGELDTLELKIITTRICSREGVSSNESDIILHRDALLIPCAGVTALEVLELQPPGKKVMNARAFWNGLRGRRLRLLP